MQVELDSVAVVKPVSFMLTTTATTCQADFDAHAGFREDLRTLFVAEGLFM